MVLVDFHRSRSRVRQVAAPVDPMGKQGFYVMAGWCRSSRSIHQIRVDARRLLEVSIKESLRFGQNGPAPFDGNRSACKIRHPGLRALVVAP